MLQSLLDGFGLFFHVEVLLFMLLGVVVSTFFSVLPGVGSLFAAVLLLPFIFTLDPIAAIAMLTAVAASSSTGNTVTSVLFGVPGSPTSVATLLDGYPMTQQGYGPQAVAAGISASVLGGFFGAFVLALMIPIARPLVLALSSPEYFVLIIIALVVIAQISEGDRLRSLLAGIAGVMVALVGRETFTGQARFTFDRLELWEGMPLVSVFVGVFAISEMLHMMRKGGSVAREGTTSVEGLQLRQVARGLMAPIRSWRATLQSSATGSIVGIVPGLGATAGQFIAYSVVARRSPRRENFGKGEVEGVIAADAATNATDGGAMIPTLAFGIPASAMFAVLLAGYVTAGVRPGPQMLAGGLDVLWMIIIVLVVANVVAAMVSLGAGAVMARLTFLPSSYIIVPILGLCLAGTYATNGRMFDVWLLVAFGLLGYGFKALNYSRSTFVIGFVLGPLLERNFQLTWNLFGWTFLQRPIVIVMLLVSALLGVVSIYRRRNVRAQTRRSPGNSTTRRGGP